MAISNGAVAIFMCTNECILVQL